MRFFGILLTIIVLAGPLSARDQTAWTDLFAALDSAVTAHRPDSVETLAARLVSQIGHDPTASDSLRAALSAQSGRELLRVARYDRAEPYLQDALDRQRELFGEEHADVAQTMEWLSVVKFRQAKLAFAELLAREALALREKLPGTSPDELASSLENLAEICRHTKSKLPEVERMLYRALDLRRSIPGAQPIDYIRTKAPLASLYRVWDQVPRADTLYHELLRTYEEAYGPDDLRVGKVLSNLGSLNLYLDRLEPAEDFLRRALPIELKHLPEVHPTIALTTFTLGVTLRAAGRYADAEQYVQRALEIWQATSGPDHPDAAGAIEELANLKDLQGEHESALNLLAQALKIRQKEFRDNYYILPEHEATEYARKLRLALGTYLCSYFNITDPSDAITDSSCSWVLRCKGELTEAVFERARRLHSPSDPTLGNLGDSITMIRQQLADVYASDPSGGHSARFARLDSLERLSTRLETSFARRCAAVGSSEPPAWDTRHAQLLLPDSTTLLEILQFRNPELETLTDSVPRYAVAVVSPTSSKLVDLGPVEGIDSLVYVYQELAYTSSEPVAGDNFRQNSVHQVLQALYRRVWQPCESTGTVLPTVMIAPDGALCSVSFAMLKSDRHYLIENHRVHYLSAGRDLRRLEKPGPLNTGLLAMGDPDFDATADTRRLALSSPGDEDLGPIVSEPMAMRSVTSQCQDFQQIKLPPLPYTRREVSKVANLWETSRQEPTRLFFRAAASEENFKRNAHGQKYLHLSTHGFFQPERCLTRTSPGSEYSDPLLYSGLFLAGSNRHGTGADAPGVDDGLLTALEVSCLDLSGTQAVVLSACQSGMGRIEVGEGVQGMRRAFQMAGARTVICAMWNIPDKATGQFMASLYRFRGDNLADAFRQIALQQIQAARTEHRPERPFVWGAFVAVGDWRR